MEISTAAVILAGGSGSRMLSNTHQSAQAFYAGKLLQVLHRVADLPMICHTLNMLQERGWSPIVVVTHSENETAIKQMLREHFPDEDIAFTMQEEPQGCLHAAQLGLKSLGKYEGNVMVLPANMPLLQTNTTLLCLEAMLAEDSRGPAAPYVGLVQRGTAKHYPVFCAARQWLEEALSAIHGGIVGDADSSATSWIRDLQQTLPRNSLDADAHALAHLASAGYGVNAASEDDLCVVASRKDLSTAESLLRGRLIAHHNAQGVTFKDPHGTFLGANVVIGKDTIVGVGVQLYGCTVIGEGVRIEGPTVITDSSLEDGVYIRSFSVLEGAHVAEGSGAGPFARLRDGTDIAPNSYVGNFVETKNAKIGQSTMACHLTYLGDAEVGSQTNIGAGTITCNFDGEGKNATRIGDGAFVGSNATLVAPVTIGSRSVIAAGSTVTQDVPEGAVTFGRARQTVKAEAAKALREKLAAKARSTA